MKLSVSDCAASSRKAAARARIAKTDAMISARDVCVGAHTYTLRLRVYSNGLNGAICFKCNKKKVV